MVIENIFIYVHVSKIYKNSFVGPVCNHKYQLVFQLNINFISVSLKTYARKKRLLGNNIPFEAQRIHNTNVCTQGPTWKIV